MPNRSARTFHLPLMESRWSIVLEHERDGWHASIWRRNPAKRATLYAVAETRAEAVRALLLAFQEFIDLANRSYRFEGQEWAGDPCPRCGHADTIFGQSGKRGELGGMRCPGCELRLATDAPPPEPLETYRPREK